jgi:uncharacterized membrane protein
MSAVKVMRNHIWVFPALALVSLVVGQLCAERCEYIQGDILGVDLDVFGLGFYSMLLASALFHKKFYPRDWFMKGMTAVAAAGVGGELVFIKFQVDNSTYCPKCLVSGFFFLVMFLLLAGNIRKWVAVLLIALGAVFTSLTFNGSVVPAYAGEAGYPTFGKAGSDAELIVYSDYFCPACRKIDLEVNAALKGLKDRVVIRFVDVPIHKGSVPYAEVFIYAWLEAGNDLEKALRVRDVLFGAAEAKAGQEGVLDILRSKGIPFRKDNAEAQRVFKEFYSPLLKIDKVKATPTLVVVRGGERTSYKGTKEILKALEELSTR